MMSANHHLEVELFFFSSFLSPATFFVFARGKGEDCSHFILIPLSAFRLSESIETSVTKHVTRVDYKQKFIAYSFGHWQVQN